MALKDRAISVILPPVLFVLLVRVSVFYGASSVILALKLWRYLFLVLHQSTIQL